jgi:hypothetical protein
MNERPTPETDAFFSRTDIDWNMEVDFARKLERERDEAREERDQYKGLLIRLHNDLFVHHGGQAVREFKELFREENYN